MSLNASRAGRSWGRLALVGLVLLVLVFALVPGAFDSLIDAGDAFRRWLARIARDLTPG
jgi:hypothetical protein